MQPQTNSGKAHKRSEGKHARWLVHTFGHISGTLSVQYATKGEVKVLVLAGEKKKKNSHC